MRGLNDKVVVVTGAAGGIGKALCQRFCEEGARVVAVDVNADALEQLSTSLKHTGSGVTAVKVDITDHGAVTAAIDTIAQELGGIDALVNNAGWDVAAKFLETTPEFWNKVIAINLVGPLNLHHAVLP